MAEQQIDRDTLRRKAKDRYTIFIRPDDLLALLDQLDQAEARIRHLEATAQVLVKEALDAENARDEHRRGRAEAEARIKAVEDALDAEEARPRAIGGGYDKRAMVRIADIRRALESDPPPGQ